MRAAPARRESIGRDLGDCQQLVVGGRVGGSHWGDWGPGADLPPFMPYPDAMMGCARAGLRCCAVGLVVERRD